MWDWTHMNGWGWHMGGFGMIIWLIILIAIIWLIVRLIQKNNGGGGESRQVPSQEESALDVLQKRYARGEITREEYQQMKQDLES